jgi:integrase
MTWLVTLPWRQRNLRECRISGSTPNLFKGPIAPFSEIDKTVWVQEEERKNPAAEFWQFHFSRDETKTGIEVEALLPHLLIGPLEEYPEKFRLHLLHNGDPEALFINQRGKPVSLRSIEEIVGAVTLSHGGRRVTPHMFREIVAFARLKSDPNCYMELSKLLWHASPAYTLSVYGSRFSESSGVCSHEVWLDSERPGRSDRSCIVHLWRWPP